MGRLAPYISMAVLAVLLAACGGRYRLRTEDRTGTPVWPYQRNTVAATGAMPQAEFSGHLDVQWEASVGGRPAGPLTIQGGTLVLPESKNRLRFYDLGTGRHLGKLRTRGIPQTGLVIADSLGFWANGPSRNVLRGYDLSRGKEVWQGSLKDALAGPIIVNSRLLVSSGEGWLCAFALANGHCDWRFDPGRRFSASASFGVGRVFQPADDGMLYAVSPDDGRELYHVQLSGPIVSSAAVEEFVFVTDVLGHVTALDPADGRTVWQTKLDAPIWASAAVAQNRVVAGTSGGDIVALDAHDGHMLWRFAAGEVVRAAPLIVGQYVVIGTMTGRVVLLRADSGTVIASVTVDGPVAWSPITDGRRIFIATQKGKILCLGESYESHHDAHQGISARR